MFEKRISFEGMNRKAGQEAKQKHGKKERRKKMMRRGRNREKRKIVDRVSKRKGEKEKKI